MKTPIEISIPPGSEMSNYLHPKMTRAELDQDLVYISLPNGYAIDVGWYPPHDPSGAFVVRSLWGVEEIDVIEVQTPYAAASLAEQIARRYNATEIPVSRSKVTETKVEF
jgi:hypothetical protein